MIKQFLAIAAMMTMISCVDENEAKPAAAVTESPSTAEADPSLEPGSKRCYASLTTSDTVILSFTMQDSIVTGDLLYQFNEKDRNKGTLKGVVRGDTLIADYSFISEGINSVRQVVFLKQGDEMIEGFGYVADDKGRMIYKDLSTLTFDKSVILKSANCDDLPPIK